MEGNGLNNTAVMDDIRKITSQTAGLILNKLEMIYPNDQKLGMARKSILGALGDRGINIDIRRILASYGMEGLEHESHEDEAHTGATNSIPNRT